MTPSDTSAGETEQTEDVCYCMVCGEEWDSFYDVKAHVFNVHTEALPESLVGYREVT